MRKLLISLAAATSALATASPAAAQYAPAAQVYPAPQAYGVPGYGVPGYGVPQPYGTPQAYGYNGYNGYNGYINNSNSLTFGRALQARIDQIQRDISVLASRRAISNNEYNGLISESRGLESRLRNTARWGLDARERYDVEVRISRLEQHVRREVQDGRGYNQYGQNGYNQYGQNQYNNGFVDRDRDGRDDRYEDDRGTRHD
jgi:hypothetical protein